MDLNENWQDAVLIDPFLKRLGKRDTVDRLDQIEKFQRLIDLVGLKRTDQVDMAIREFSLDVGLFFTGEEFI